MGALSVIEYKSKIADLGPLNDKIQRILEDGMIAGMRQFEAKFIKEQLSGRKSGRGLNTQTGNLRNRWMLKPFKRGSKSFRIRLATATKYAAIHQFGGDIDHPGGTPYTFINGKTVWMEKPAKSSARFVRYTKPHKIGIPKRLYILEDFPVSGVKLMRQQVSKRIRRLANAK